MAGNKSSTMKTKEWTKQSQKLYGGNPSIISLQVTAQVLTGQYIYYLIIICSKSIQPLINALLSSPSHWPQCFLGVYVYKTTYCAQKGNSEVSVWSLPGILTAAVKICFVHGWWSETCRNITLSCAWLFWPLNSSLILCVCIDINLTAFPLPTPLVAAPI